MPLVLLAVPCGALAVIGVSTLVEVCIKSGGWIMPISGKRYPFTQENIDNSPTAKGVYALYDDETAIYIGRGDSENGIRSRLRTHKRGAEGPCTKVASHYRREIYDYPKTRERELLKEYMQTYGKLPRCNDVMP